MRNRVTVGLSGGMGRLATGPGLDASPSVLTGLGAQSPSLCALRILSGQDLAGGSAPDPLCPGCAGGLLILPDLVPLAEGAGGAQLALEEVGCGAPELPQALGLVVARW